MIYKLSYDGEGEVSVSQIPLELGPLILLVITIPTYGQQSYEDILRRGQ